MGSVDQEKFLTDVVNGWEKTFPALSSPDSTSDYKLNHIGTLANEMRRDVKVRLGDGRLEPEEARRVNDEILKKIHQFSTPSPTPFDVSEIA